MDDVWQFLNQPLFSSIRERYARSPMLRKRELGTATLHERRRNAIALILATPEIPRAERTGF